MAGDLVTDKEFRSALDNIMLLYENDTKKRDGEITTLEYAQKKGISTNRAYKELDRLFNVGKLKKRRPEGGRHTFWSEVEAQG